MSNQGHPGSLDLSGYSLGPGQSLPDPTPGQPASSGRARSLGPVTGQTIKRLGPSPLVPSQLPKKPWVFWCQEMSSFLLGGHPDWCPLSPHATSED